MNRVRFLILPVIAGIVLSCAGEKHSPISVYPGNPHYFLYKDKPEMLITSAEHYGAVVNRKFDYNKYFDWLASYGLNYTRIYPGYLTEPPDKWIKGNTLGLKSDEVIMPWKRSNEPGYAMGGNKFDLDHWDKDFFDRLKDFIGSAAKRDIIVEICFFNAQYDDCWPLCPLYYRNNIQQVGNCNFNTAQTLNDTALLMRESDYVARIVREVNNFDNVILEICDEPVINGTPLSEAGQWLDHMIGIVINTEKKLPNKHLVAQQVEGPLNGPCDFSTDPRVSVITCQYDYRAYGEQLGGLKGIDLKYDIDKPIELNETYYYPRWYKGDSIGDSRVEAWEFIAGGGSAFNHLNGQYTVGNPSGNTPDNQQVCNTLKVLKDFMHSFDFTRMKPDTQFVAGGIPDSSFCRGMSWKGNQYALYIHHSRCTSDSAAYTVIPGRYRHDLLLDLPDGNYTAEWIDPATGMVQTVELADAGNGLKKITTPVYSVDIALRIKKSTSQAHETRAIDISQNRRYFTDKNGKPFLWLGDTEWELFHQLTFADAKSLMLERRSQGFNVIQVMVTGVYPEWATMTGTEPWKGSEAWLGNNPLTPNEDYFRRTDSIVALAEKLDLVLVVGVYHARDVDEGRITVENARKWSRWLANRYKNAGNIIWSMYPHATEASKPVIKATVEGIMEGDGGAHLITMHPDPSPTSSSFMNQEGWLSFNTLQTWSCDFSNYNMVQSDYEKVPVKPVVDGEARYEEEDGTTPFNVRRAGYWACLAGGFYSYGHRDNWKSPLTWRKWFDTPGARQVMIMGNILKSVEWWKMIPDQAVFAKNLSGNAGARSSEGDWILAYLTNPDPVTINMNYITGSATAAVSWFDPLTGKRSDAGELPASGSQIFYPPAGAEDAVLLIEKISW